MTTKIDWHIVDFDELSVQELHDILALRIAIFVVEQDCPYQDIDGQDVVSRHVYATSGQRLLAYLRILPPDDNDRVSIGRVVVSSTERGTGMGHRLMEKGMAEVQRLHGRVIMKVSAQEHLRQYYGRHGFVQCGEGYLEDGIPHIPMEYTPT